MTTRGERIGQLVTVGVALVFAVAVLGVLFGGLSASSPAARPGPATASPAPPPTIAVAQDTCCDQTARFLKATWESSEVVRTAAVTLTPPAGFDCGAAIETGGRNGTFGCVGLLRGGTAYIATLRVTTAAGSFPYEHRFKTMGDRLENVKWFTEFENPSGEPLACAAASCRIIQNYTSGKDPMTAEQILALGRTLNRSNDPGIDPAAVAQVLTRLEARNRYHYYRLDTREEATKSAVYWLVRSGKPVMVISLAGQHGPVLTGFRGVFGTYYDDPSNSITGVVVQDPQRGDMRPETANRRPDKYRSPGFQTGQLLELPEWYGDEWWLAFPYAASLKEVGSIDRSDNVYPRPHWAGKFVILVDDGDTENPPDREGRVRFHG